MLPDVGVGVLGAEDVQVLAPFDDLVPSGQGVQTINVMDPSSNHPLVPSEAATLYLFLLEKQSPVGNDARTSIESKGWTTNPDPPSKPRIWQTPLDALTNSMRNELVNTLP